MSEEILLRLDKLAAALGVSIEYIMDALVKGQVMSGAFAAVVAVIFLLILIIGARICRAGYRALSRCGEEEGYQTARTLRDDAISEITVGTIVVVISLGVFLLALYNAVLGLGAPEAGAVRELLRLLG